MLHWEVVRHTSRAHEANQHLLLLSFPWRKQPKYSPAYLTRVTNDEKTSQNKRSGHPGANIEHRATAGCNSNIT